MLDVPKGESMSVIDYKPVRLLPLALAVVGTIYGLAANSAPVRLWERPAAPAERAEPSGPVTILPVCASGWRCAADASDLLWCSCQMPKRGEP